MSNAAIEQVKQRFGGTAQELKEFILAYVIEHAARTPQPIGPSDYLTLIPALDDSDLFFVVREKARLSKSRKMQFDPKPPREGTIRIKQVTLIPPRSEFVCRVYTAACRQWALDLAGETAGKGYDQAGNTRSPDKSGRLHCPADEWAYLQMHELKRPASEVYSEWAARLDVRARKLVNPERQFRRLKNPA